MTKLNHQPFSDWLLSDEPLSPAEMHQLQEHLHSCQECQQHQLAWSHVKRLFMDVGQVQPAGGFVNRWQQRLINQRHLRQRKIAWVWFGVSVGLAGLALAFLGYLAFDSLQSPLSFLAVWIYRLTVAFSFWSSLEGYLGVIQGLWPSFNLTAVILLAGFTSFLSVLWLATFKQLSAARRIVR